MPKQKKQHDNAMIQVLATPLSDSDIRAILGDDIKILTNRELVNYKAADDLFDRCGRCVLLYTPEDPTFGHWVCLLRKSNHIEYFDSYGEIPDHPDYLGTQEPLLTYLLKESGLPILYNTRQFQSDKKNVADCGKWACARLMYFPYSIDRFSKIVDSFKGKPDSFVGGLIFGIIRK